MHWYVQGRYQCYVIRMVMLSCLGSDPAPVLEAKDRFDGKIWKNYLQTLPQAPVLFVGGAPPHVLNFCISIFHTALFVCIGDARCVVLFIKHAAKCNGTQRYRPRPRKFFYTVGMLRRLCRHSYTLRQLHNQLEGWRTLNLVLAISFCKLAVVLQIWLTRQIPSSTAHKNKHVLVSLARVFHILQA